MPRPFYLNLLRLSQAVKFGLSVTGLTLVVLANLGLNPSQARNRPSSHQGHCQQSLTELMPPLLEALPSYTNRVMQRSQIGGVPLRTYILIAGNADFDPLPLAQQQWQPAVPDTTKQVFFTTLERSYTDQRAIASQNFYWAFFVQTGQGWQLALLYQQLGGSSPDQPTSPRRDASTGAIAQGIRLWLRDCQAGVFAAS
ncbi:hypothetical protein H6G45_01315 [Synechocystis sp. FACHB-383]|uniref:hypothetical protein n=1 Tax=Synechocystis sp. FACHB-383 TaxID=2692864 RepID=UPI001686178C|nr:hypothetical protein [Synechocystis sp. FACHB-383]MBD2652149.1 hypothetical protein [Synechocystis sp. FACHB-383]